MLISGCLCRDSKPRTVFADAVRRTDPTGTGALRRDFDAELTRRWRALRSLIDDAVNKSDLLRLGTATTAGSLRSLSSGPTYHQALPHGDLITNFAAWLNEQINQTVLKDGGTWTQVYVQRAVAMGRARAATQTGQASVVSQQRAVALEATAVAELRGIASAVTQQCTRVASAAALGRWRAARAARDMAEVVRSVGQRRGEAMTDYMIVKAFNSAVLDSLRNLGHRTVGVRPEYVIGSTRTTDAGPSDEPRDQLGRWAGGGDTMYHGSPTNSIQKFSGHVYVTSNKSVARQYAHGSLMGAQKGVTRDTPTVYELRVDRGKVFDLRKPAHREIYAELRKEHNARQQDTDYHLPSVNSEGFLGSKTGLPSFGHARQILHLAEQRGFHSISVDEGSQGESLLIANGDKQVSIAHKHVDAAVVELRSPTLFRDAKKKKKTKKPRKTKKAKSKKAKFSAPPSPSKLAQILKYEQRVQSLGEVNVLTAGDDLVCQVCEDISDNGPYDIDAAEHLIPAHPHCRCAFEPVEDNK